MSPSARLALMMFAVYSAVAVSVYAAGFGAPSQHWSARVLASLVVADGLCDLGVAAYLRFIRKRPRRSEGLFLVLALVVTAFGWYAIRDGLSFGVVAAFVVVTFLLRRLLKPVLFDPWWADGGNLVMLPADDAALNAAKAEAVATLPEFLRRLSAPGADLASAAVKAPLPVPGGTEHVWLDNIRCDGAEFVGTVANHPSPETGVRLGATVRVRHSEISDWKIVERGQLVGGFTIRFFLSRMAPAQRAALSEGVPFTIGPEAIPPAA